MWLAALLGCDDGAGTEDPGAAGGGAGKGEPDFVREEGDEGRQGGALLATAAVFVLFIAHREACKVVSLNVSRSVCHVAQGSWMCQAVLQSGAACRVCCVLQLVRSYTTAYTCSCEA
jgi:hypothetical protein